MAGQRTWYAVSKLRRTGVCHHLATVILLSLRLRFQVGKWHLGMSSWSYTPTYRGERPPPVTISTTEPQITGRTVIPNRRLTARWTCTVNMRPAAAVCGAVAEGVLP
jgi:hypothetical protein